MQFFTTGTNNKLQANSFSPSDLSSYSQLWSQSASGSALKVQTVTGPNDPTNPTGEPSLDVQSITALNPLAANQFELTASNGQDYWWAAGFVSRTNIAQVVSISYGIDESVFLLTDPRYANAKQDGILYSQYLAATNNLVSTCTHQCHYAAVARLLLVSACLTHLCCCCCFCVLWPCVLRSSWSALLQTLLPPGSVAMHPRSAAARVMSYCRAPHLCCRCCVGWPVYWVVDWCARYDDTGVEWRRRCTGLGQRQSPQRRTMQLLQQPVGRVRPQRTRRRICPFDSRMHSHHITSNSATHTTACHLLTTLLQPLVIPTAVSPPSVRM